jgi:hypothetical protein
MFEIRVSLRHHLRSSLRIWPAVLVCALQACGGSPAAFSPTYPDNRDGQVQALMARVEASPIRVAPAIAVGAASGRLFAYDLSARKQLWQHALPMSAAPHLAGDNVVLELGDEVVGYDLRSGERSFAIDRGELSLRGTDGEGERVALVLGRGQGTLARSEALLIEDGSVQWRRPFEGQGGVPALAGSAVLVPWSAQFLSGLEVDDGREFARLRVRDGVMSHALARAGAAFVGSFHGIARLNTNMTRGKLRAAAHFALPESELPGRPALLPDLYTGSQGARLDSAEHRIGLAYTPLPTSNSGMQLQDDNLYLYFYRFVFALDPRTAAVRWVHVHEADVVGARAQRHGLLLGDERGHFALLGAASGESIWSAQNMSPSSVMRLPETGPAARSGRAPAPNALRVRLLGAIEHPDARLAPARVFAVDELARMQPTEVTADLVRLCDSDMLAPLVRERACLKLEQRPSGAEHLLGALARHAGHLEGTTSPQVGALATAAASLELKRAVPLLITHLQDPATRSSDLPALVSSLEALGDPGAGAPLARFFTLYHADAIDSGMVRALERVPAALLALRPAQLRSTLAEVSADELGIYSVRQQTRAALDKLKQLEAAEAAAKSAKEAAKDDATGEAQTPAQAPPETAVAPADAVPERLTTPLIDAALLPVRDRLLACMDAANRVMQARILLVVEDGQAKTIAVLPVELQACIEPLLRAQGFPRSKAQYAEPERVTYTLKR